jgi:hypothetical protein
MGGKIASAIVLLLIPSGYLYSKEHNLLPWEQVGLAFGIVFVALVLNVLVSD